MRKILLLTFLAFTTSFTFAQQAVRLTRFEGQEIKSISASMPVKVTISQGTATKAVVEMSPELEEHLIFTLKNGHLTISVDNRGNQFNGKFWDNIHFTANVVMSRVDEIDLSTTAELSSTGTITGDKISIEASSASKIQNLKLNVRDVKLELNSAASATIDLTAQELRVDLNSAAHATLSGSAANASIDVSSAANLQAADLTIRSGRAKASSTGKARVHFTEKAEIQTNSMGKVNYSGSANYQFRTDSGAMRVD